MYISRAKFLQKSINKKLACPTKIPLKALQHHGNGILWVRVGPSVRSPLCRKREDLPKKNIPVSWYI